VGQRFNPPLHREGNRLGPAERRSAGPAGYQRLAEDCRASSASAPTLAQTIAGSTFGEAAKRAKPQSVRAMTFSRPTRRAKR
jgi:hypothetical protein